jgi:hypothetical protein
VAQTVVTLGKIEIATATILEEPGLAELKP